MDAKKIYDDMIKDHADNEGRDYTTFSLLEKNLLKFWRGSINRNVNPTVRDVASTYVRLLEFRTFLDSFLNKVEAELTEAKVQEYFGEKAIKVILDDMNVVRVLPFATNADWKKAGVVKPKK